jgi:hypothetical protein
MAQSAFVQCKHEPAEGGTEKVKRRKCWRQKKCEICKIVFGILGILQSKKGIFDEKKS